MTINQITQGQQIIEELIKKLANNKEQQANKNGLSTTYIPIFDGPFDIEKYVNSQIKIMFILKEPNSSGVTFNDYKKDELSNDTYFGSMNDVAKGILFSNPTPDIGDKLNNSAIIRYTVFTNISNFQGQSNTPKERLFELYKDNVHILENKFLVYSPDIIICGGVYQTIKETIKKVYGGIKTIVDKYFDINGNVLPSVNGNITAAHYYLTNTNREIIVIEAYHNGAIEGRWNYISRQDWVKGIMCAIKNKP